MLRNKRIGTIFLPIFITIVALTPPQLAGGSPETQNVLMEVGNLLAPKGFSAGILTLGINQASSSTTVSVEARGVIAHSADFNVTMGMFDWKVMLSSNGTDVLVLEGKAGPSGAEYTLVKLTDSSLVSFGPSSTDPVVQFHMPVTVGAFTFEGTLLTQADNVTVSFLVGSATRVVSVTPTGFQAVVSSGSIAVPSSSGVFGLNASSGGVTIAQMRGVYSLPSTITATDASFDSTTLASIGLTIESSSGEMLTALPPPIIQAQQGATTPRESSTLQIIVRKSGEIEPASTLFIKTLDSDTASVVSGSLVTLTSVNFSKTVLTGPSGTVSTLVPKGSYDLVVTKDGYRAYQGNFNLEHGQSTELFIQLRRAETSTTSLPPTIHEGLGLVVLIGTAAAVAYAIIRRKSK